MISKPTKKKELKNNSLEILKTLNECKVSKASNELMLERFYNGKGIEFPFSN